MDNCSSSLKADLLVNLRRLSKRIENIETQLQDERHYLNDLIEQIKDLKPEGVLPAVESATRSKAEQHRYVDGRTLPNPEKNLKISVRRILEWSKKSGRTSKEAQARALAVLEDAAKGAGFKEFLQVCWST